MPFELLVLFSDTLYIVRDEEGNVVYPTEPDQMAYLDQFVGKPGGVFYSPKDDKHYHLEARRTADQKYLVYRFSDISKQLNSHYEVDACTGLFIRKKFLEIFSSYLLQLKDKPEDFAVAIADIDFFKMVNDQYGHLAGDKVLRDVSQTLFNNIRSKATVTFNGKTITRPVDIIGRYGGEEFVFVMKNITPENASSRINQIREKIGKLNSEFVYPNDGKEVHIPVTASFGVAHITKELLNSLDFTEENVEEVCNYFIEEADEMLYKSKHNGRNVVSLKKVNQNSLDNSNIIADENKTKTI